MKLAAMLALLAVLLVSMPARAAALRPWPQLDAFVQAFVSDDGRVVDPIDARRYTTSEGQSYALFFALVAGDRPLFDRLLRWTHDNLADGDLGQRLPGWQWGRLADGNWGLADRNPASDADLWIAYSLLEAGRLWNDRGYRVLGKSLAARILREETADLPGLGLSLLPGPSGFVLSAERWRLNPSYTPLPLLQALVVSDPEHAAEWQALVDASQRLILGSSRNGHAPDWTIYDARTGFESDTDTGPIGSYNAIRVYLWAGLMPPQQQRDAQLAALAGMAEPVLPPQKAHLDSGRREGDTPVGFAAAVLPFQQALGRETAVATLREHLRSAGWPLAGYYDSVLSLFGSGFDEGRYCFDARGQLGFGREGECAPSR